MSLTQDGRTVVTGWADGAVRLYTPESGSLVEEVRAAVPGPGGVTALAVSQAGGQLVVGGADGSVRLWHIGRGQAKLVKTVRSGREPLH